MKKLILANNEEKKIIRHLHESVKRQYLNLNEQGKWDGVTVSPLDTDKSEKVDDNDSMISDVSIGQRDASDFTYKSKKVKRPPNPSVTELQTNLNTKFSSGLVPDGYLGQKTRNAIYDALTKGSQQTTQQTITVPQQVKSDGGTPNDDN
jgi:peptidoglycan hydrolase-like protein with peptidoglycan-binding domain